MEDSKLYSTQDIENLKQKIALYRDTLNSLRAGNTVDVKGETESIRKEEYGERVKNISVQIESINQTVEVLSQDFSVIMDLLKSHEVNDLIESINTLVDIHDSINIANEIAESEIETVGNHTEIVASPIPAPTLRLSYKQLKNFFNNANDIQEITADPEPVVNISMGSKSVGRRSFPSLGVNSAQKKKGQYRNFHTKPTNALNRVILKQAMPLKFTPTDIQTEEKTADMKTFDSVQNDAVIGEVEHKSPLLVEEKIEQVVEDVAEKVAEDKAEMVEEEAVELVVEDTEETVAEDKAEMIVEDAAETILKDTIEQVNEVVEESNIKEKTDKTKNRDFFAFFNFFQKKG